MAESTPSNARDQSATGAPVGRIRLKELTWRVSVLIAALLGALLALPMIILGLVVDMTVVLLLLLITAALLAALGAGWSGTLLAPDRTRTRLLSVVGICEGMAVSLAVLMSLLTAFVDVFIIAPPAVVIVAFGATWATWRYRSSRIRMGWSARLTLALAVISFVVSYDLLSSGFLGVNILGLLLYLPFDPLVLVLVIGAVSVVLGVVLALWHFQRRGDVLGVDAATTLVLAGAGPLLVIGILYVAELFGLVGA